MGFKGKSGGGFWNNVDGEFVDYIFETFKSAKGDLFISLQPSIKVDGQEEASSRGLLFGAADKYDISEDGKTVTAKEGDTTSYAANLPAGQWLDSLVAAGEKLEIEAALPDLDAGEPLNLEGILGTRFRLGTIPDVKGTKDRGQEVGKDGVSRDRRFNVITEIYSLGGTKTGGKKAVTGKAGKPSAKTVVWGNLVQDAADAIVLEAIAAAQKADKKNKTGEIPAPKLKMAALRAPALAGDKALKDAVIKLVGSDEYLNGATERGVFVYDADGETVASA